MGRKIAMEAGGLIDVEKSGSQSVVISEVKKQIDQRIRNNRIMATDEF
jgi:hypothetical protein